MSKTSNASGQPSGRPREFEPVETSAEADKMIWEAAKTHASVFLWTQEPTKVSYQTHLQVADVNQRAMTFWSPPEFDPQAFTQALAQSPSADCLFSISLSRANIFFKARFRTADMLGLHFSYPDAIFKVQRRKDMRVGVPDGYVMRVEFVDPSTGRPTSKKVLDISASGLAFVAEEGEQDLFVSGTKLQNVSFVLRSRKITVAEAEIRHGRSLSKDARMPGYKIGLAFQKIAEADSQAIAQYVFEESRRYFAKFI